MRYLRARTIRPALPLLLIVWLATAGLAAAFVDGAAAPTADVAPPAAAAGVRAAAPVTDTVNADIYPLGPEWLAPVNLSRSGAAGDPVFLLEPDGNAHLLWQDAVAGFLYSHNRWTLDDAATWSPAITVSVPFTGIVPVLFPTDEATIGAFWIGSEEVIGQGDDELFPNALWYSRAAAEELGEGKWADGLMLSESVLDFDVVRSRDGRLHLSYIGSPRKTSADAGLYYLVSEDGGANWSAPVQLYDSAYLRPSVIESGHVVSALSERSNSSSLLIAWDNPALEKLFVIRSTNGGENWSEPREVDRRQTADAAGALGPRGIELLANGDRVHLVWQAGHDAATCGLYHQQSLDAGRSWSARSAIPLDTAICPTAHRFLGSIDRMPLLLVEDGASAAFLAWNGRVWSPRQEQRALKTFTHPDTLREITFGCYQPTLVSGGIIVVGCDESETPDIWLTMLSLEEMRNWFNIPSPWRDPQTLPTNAEPIVDAQMLGDADGRVHMFWSEAGDDGLFYVLGAGTRWSTPFAALTSPAGGLGTFGAAVTPQGRIVVVWQDTVEGLYFSQVDVAASIIPRNWSEPFLLPGLPTGANNPTIAGDAAGNLVVVFSVAVNEARGLYISRFDAATQQWSAATPIFDGAASGWQVVGAPEIALTEDGTTHVLWPRQDITAADEPINIALSYARLAAGETTPARVESVAEGTINWYTLRAYGERLVHRMYVTVDGSAIAFNHDISANSGQVWEGVPRLSNLKGQLAVDVDAAGGLHMAEVTPDELHEWTFVDGRWQLVETRRVTEEAQGAFLAAANNRLATVYAFASSEGGGQATGLAYTLRRIEVPATPAPLPPPPPVVEAPAPEAASEVVNEAEAPAPVRTREPVPVPSPSFSLPFSIPFVDQLGGDSPTERLVASIIPAGVLVTLLVGLAFLVSRGFHWLMVRRSR